MASREMAAACGRPSSISTLVITGLLLVGRGLEAGRCHPDPLDMGIKGLEGLNTFPSQSSILRVAQDLCQREKESAGSLSLNISQRNSGVPQKSSSFWLNLSGKGSNMGPRRRRRVPRGQRSALENPARRGSGPQSESHLLQGLCSYYG